MTVSPTDSTAAIEREATAERAPLDMRVRDLGRMKYAEALELQRRLQAEVITARMSGGEVGREAASGLAVASSAGETGMVHLLLVEHDPPVITISRRPGARQHLLATDAMLANAGVEVCETDRGGDITYHGPGQLVVYPILDLNRFGLRIDSYMRMLEQIVIEVLAQFGIAGQRDAKATGVWVHARDKAQRLPSLGPNAPSTQPSKICAMGVRVSRWVSMHGLALNVTTNLDHFKLIVPCGLAGRSVTSMRRELGDECPTMDAVKRSMVDRFEHALGARISVDLTACRPGTAPRRR